MEQKTIPAVILAGGSASRFGSNKLLAELNGLPLVLHTALRLQEDGGFNLLAVTCHDAVRDLFAQRGIACLLTETCRQGLSGSVRAGVSAMREKGAEEILFFAGDQPFLKAETLHAFYEAWQRSGKGLGSCLAEGSPTNPAIFTRQYFSSLCSLEGDRGGRKILQENPADCFFWPLPDPAQAEDIDTIKQLQRAAERKTHV